MSFGQNVALVMVNKFVKFELSYGRDMLKIGKIYEIAIHGKVTSPLRGHVF